MPTSDVLRTLFMIVGFLASKKFYRECELLTIWIWTYDEGAVQGPTPFCVLNAERVRVRTSALVCNCDRPFAMRAVPVEAFGQSAPPSFGSQMVSPDTAAPYRAYVSTRSGG